MRDLSAVDKSRSHRSSEPRFISAANPPLANAFIAFSLRDSLVLGLGLSRARSSASSSGVTSNKAANTTAASSQSIAAAASAALNSRLAKYSRDADASLANLLGIESALSITPRRWVVLASRPS